MHAEDAPGPVTAARDGDVLLVTIDNPPVNALSHAVRKGLLAAVALLETDASLRAMVVASTGRTYIGGADIREFSGPRLDPLLNRVCAAIDECDKPIVVAIHGAALGGGFEIALAAHARVAAPRAEVAFPEVLLGLLPGAGGTQRAPRLCGAQAALDLMLTGKRLSAHAALAAHLIDIVDDEPLPTALRVAQALASQTAPLPRARGGRALADQAATARAIAAARAALPVQYAGLYSPARIIDCVERAATLPFDEGCAYEAQAFAECLASPQRAVLVERSFAERAARKGPPTTPESAAPS
ncbi:enoyl-CoA hydratase/isomerase family protein [Gemmatimonas sp.]